MTSEIKEIKSRVNANVSRVEGLVKVYTEMGKNGNYGQGRRPTGFSDVLRAATVLLHASIEDLLRSIARWKLPLTRDAAALKDYPFPVSVLEKRQDKVTMGDLLKFKSKSAKQIIKQGINEYLDRSSYNNTREIARLLKDLKIPDENMKEHYSDIEKMMKRRHHIVHQADRNDTPGQGHHKTKPINVHTLNKWINCVRDFSNKLLDELESM